MAFRSLLLLHGRIGLIAAVALVGCAPKAAGQAAPLVLERSIPLPGVTGRIDHLALDSRHGRLYVAALGAQAVEAVDLVGGKVAGRIAGLREPQGLALLEGRGELVVASRGDGSVRFFRTDDLAPIGELSVGDDADNVHVEPGSGRVVVGYGAGALALIDPATRRVVGATPLPAHPEGFQLDGTRVFVNLPDAGGIGVADLATGRLVATWSNRGRRFNFPLAFDPDSSEVAVVYRLPSRLVTFDARTGAERQALPTCGDADDIFYDRGRSRLYVSCGDGHVDVFVRRGGVLARLARIATAEGARTALFSPETDRLYVAARASGGHAAAILVLRPQ